MTPRLPQVQNELQAVLGIHQRKSQRAYALRTWPLIKNQMATARYLFGSLARLTHLEAVTDPDASSETTGQVRAWSHQTFTRSLLHRVRDCVLACLTVWAPGCTDTTFRDTALRGSTTAIVDSSGHHVDYAALLQVRSEAKPDEVVAWGRYIINQAGESRDRNGARELTASELLYLRNLRIPLIPIVAPNQKALNGNRQDGETLAKAAIAILTGIASGFANDVNQEIIVYLDVEGDKNPISAEYLLGWCFGLRNSISGNLTILPGVYANAGIAGQSARKAIATMHQSCGIAGVWFASYINVSGIPHTWREMRRDRKNVLVPLPDEIPIYFWQFRAGSDVDWNVVNPELSALVDEFGLRLW